MPPLNILIKPASSLCNMRCRYCFYRDVADNRRDSSFGIMSEDTLEAFLKNVFSSADSQISFTFQGGEPTLAGVRYFEKFHELVEKYNLRHLPTSFSLQTNGYDVSEELVLLFAKHRYLLGVSLDGGAALHNLYRVGADGASSYDKVIATIALLDKHRVEYNILSVITEDLAKRGAEAYRRLRDGGFRFLQFIPFVPDFGCEGREEPYYLSNDSYAYFLNETFAEYRRDFIAGRYVSVRQFDNFVRIAAGLGAECCGMGGRCTASLVVEADGGVYPCDFYVLDEWRMGNITRDPVDRLLSSEAAKKFVDQSLSIVPECTDCRFLPICRGGCRRHRDDSLGNILLNRYCEAYKSFFGKSLSGILDMAQRLKKK